MTSETKVTKNIQKIETEISQLEKKIIIKSIIPTILIILIIALALYLIFSIINFLLPEDILKFTRYFLSILGCFISLGFILPFIYDNKKGSFLIYFFAPNLGELKEKLEKYKNKKTNAQNKLELFKQIKVDYWQNLKGIDLELATQNLFSRYLNVKLYLTSTTGDGGIDIQGSGVIFQCKGNKSKIGEPAIRDFYGAASSLGIKSHRSIFVAPYGFTASAIKFANHKMKLVDAESLTNIAKNELEKITNNKF